MRHYLQKLSKQGSTEYIQSVVRTNSTKSDNVSLLILFDQGYYDESKFIAAQGPTENNVVDFWLMIWQQNIKHIVMVTRLFEANKVNLSLKLHTTN